MYENLTDRELIRTYQDHSDPLVRALAERLDMRLRDMDDMEYMKPVLSQQGTLFGDDA